MAKPAKTKTDNIGGVLYEAARKSKIRNPRFKAAFIASIPREKNYSKTVHALIHRYKQTGELKCESGLQAVNVSLKAPLTCP